MLRAGVAAAAGAVLAADVWHVHRCLSSYYSDADDYEDAVVDDPSAVEVGRRCE
jgi:hypothetical protein